MAEHTTHYNITKPTGSEAGDVSVINANMDIIDGQLYENEQAIQENAEAIQENAEAIENLSTDYIVEQGTSGGWTYRKWNSGIAECYALFNVVISMSDWNAWEGWTYCRKSVNIPFPLRFVNINNVQITTQAPDSPTSACSTNETTLIYIDFIRPNAINTTLYYYVNVKGRWK